MAWITVHGRTTRQRGEPANWDAIKLVFVVKLNILVCIMDFLLKGLIIIYEEWGKGKICWKDQNFNKLPLPPPRNVNSK